MRRLCSLLLLLALATPVQGVLTLEGPSGPVEPRETVQVFVRGLAESELPTALANHWPRERTTFVAAKTWGGDPFLWFAARAPGRYLLMVTSYQAGVLCYAECVVVVVEGDSPDPPPPPPPPVPGELSVVVIHETLTRGSELSRQIAEVRGYLGAQTYHSRVTDQDLKGGKTNQTPPWFQKRLDAWTASALSLPVIVIGKEGAAGEFSAVAVEPFDEGAIETIKGHGG